MNKTTASVSWADVWAWTDRLEAEHGVYCHIDVYPPRAGAEGFVECVVVLTARQWTSTGQTDLPGDRTTMRLREHDRVQAAAIRMVAALYMELDRRAGRPANGAGRQERMF